MSSTKYFAIAAGLASVLCASTLRADSLLIIYSELQSGPVALMQATGQFSTVSSVSAENSTPTLAQLSSYNAVLVYTNAAPYNATALGNVLDQYYALGNRFLTIATFGFDASPYGVAGAVMQGNDDAFTTGGPSVNPSGNLMATMPNDPIFTGINLSTVTYFHNGNFTNPGLAAGATLLATDGAGVNMIARSANGIVNVNLFPSEGYAGNNAELYDLLANTLTQAAPVPEPSSLVLFGLVALAFAVVAKRRLARTPSISRR